MIAAAESRWPIPELARTSGAAELNLSSVLSALSYALDLTEGMAPGHTIRTCIIGMRIGRELGLSDDERSALYYSLLLKDAGCSSNSARMAELFGSDDTMVKMRMKQVDWHHRFTLAVQTFRNCGVGQSMGERVRHFMAIAKTPKMTHEIIQTRCDRGADIALQLGFPGATADAIRSLDEHWCGLGHPTGLTGEAIPLLARITNLAQTLELFWREHGVRIDARGLDDVAIAFANIIDAKSPFTYRHSWGVASIATALARTMGLPATGQRDIYRAGLLHDIGKLGVSSMILERVDAFRSLASLASTHHEKLDGSGYPYGVHGDRLNLDARILVVADIFEALTADRPYRAGMPVQEALALMSRDAGTRLDATVLEALPEALS